VTDTPIFHPASFRDPEGRVFQNGSRIFRTLSDTAALRMRSLEKNGRLEKLIATGMLIPSTLVSSSEAVLDPKQFGDVVMEHERIPLIVYPYEWSFDMLRDAALLTLDLMSACLEMDLILKDATSFNVTPYKNRMVFLDTLSLDDYREGQPWEGYSQFCREFLYPLFLTSHKGVEFQPWMRAELNGLKASTMSRIFGWLEAPFKGVLTHVHLQAFFERRFANRDIQVLSKFESRLFPKKALLRMLESIRRLVRSMKYRALDSVWDNYESDNSYSPQDEEAKKSFVMESSGQLKANTWVDIGCNAGKFSDIIAKTGSRPQTVIGLEADAAAANAFYLRFRNSTDNFFYPIVTNLLNPTPAMGWGLSERAALFDRVQGEGFLALALVHHICIANNIPLEGFIKLLNRFGHRGVVEWVDKQDAMVQRLLRNRKDVFPDYKWDEFERCLKTIFRVERVVETHGGHRRLCQVRAL